MSTFRFFSLPTAIGILQWASIPVVNAATPGRFKLEWETHNFTIEEAGSRYTGSIDDYRLRNGIRLTLGTPPQDVYLTPVASETGMFVIDLQQCEPRRCESIVGGQFASNESSTWKPLAVQDLKESGHTNPMWVGGGNFTIGTDVGQLPGASINITLEQIGQNISLLTTEPEVNFIYPNVLGLGNGSEFLENLVKNDVIPERAFGFHGSTLDIGGIDEDRIDGERFESPIVPDIIGGFRVTVTDMEIDGKSIMTRTPEPFNASISMTMGSNYFPRFVYEEFMNMTGGEEPGIDSALVFPGWDDTKTPYTNYNLTVTLSNGLKLSAPELFFRFKYQNWNYPYNSSMTTIYPMDLIEDDRKTEGVGAYFGMGFLNHTYLYVDHERQVFELADAKQVPTVNGNGGNNSASGDDPSSASFVKTNIYAWAVVLFSSAIMVGVSF